LNTESNNRRITKNTLLLYFRMMVITVVSLFTVRITLKILGIEDYGIYNVVAGIVGFLGMLNGAMVSATQRFLTYELGLGNMKRYSQVFSMLITMFVLLSVVILIVSILIGSWVIKDFLVIPTQKQGVALWLYYFSVVTFIFNLLSIPYMSSIISYEKMAIYAYVSFAEVILKLILVYSLYVSSYDKLLTYGFLTMCSSFMITFIYRVYCSTSLSGCKYRFYWQKSLFKQLIGYTGWNLFGSVTAILNLQGQSIILNLFFGPVVNAAKAIADRINGIVSSFSNNFYMAIRPQIVKSYASGDIEYMFKLVYRSSKLSFYMLFILVLPLIILMERVLSLWLGDHQVTRDMIVFSQLILVFSLVNVFEQPITIMIQATGNIKNYEMIIGFATLLLLPFCYLAFKFGFPAYFSLIILILIYSFAQIFRMYIAKKQLGLSIMFYCQNIFKPILFASVPAIILSYLIDFTLSNNFVGMVLSGLFCLIITCCCIFIFGIDKVERNIIVQRVNLLLNKYL
jgi:O-antigen/teichoic acid export membrane protein